MSKLVDVYVTKEDVNWKMSHNIPADEPTINFGGKEYRVADWAITNDAAFVGSRINARAVIAPHNEVIRGYKPYDQAFKLRKELMTNMNISDQIERVIFNAPATIVYWKDGTKTVVKCEYEEFDREKGLAMAIAKKVFGNKGSYFNQIKKWTEE